MAVGKYCDAGLVEIAEWVLGAGHCTGRRLVPTSDVEVYGAAARPSKKHSGPRRVRTTAMLDAGPFMLLADAISCR